ncbi:MAG: SEL1-like repeat protein, partial [Gammaproteobacteria bacterium]|nr:SEL1-like repeat protein [Gammaproteobacteria bacterium]
MIVLRDSVKELSFYLLIASLCWQSTVVLAKQKLHQDDWYLSQPGDRATIQMSGHESERAAIAYIEKENLSGDVGYYQTLNKDMPWYAVTYGNFKSVEAARAHVKLLPNRLQQHSPWPRTFQKIGALIKTAELLTDDPGEAIDVSSREENNPVRTNKQPVAANWESGQAAYDAGNYHEAHNIWQVLAEQGDELSQFNLAVTYSSGEGTEKNDRYALEWYTKSAEQGYAPAQFNLGAVYLEGKFTDEEAKKAATWWQMAADQGFVQAQ